MTQEMLFKVPVVAQATGKSRKYEKDCIFDIIDALCAPIIVYPSVWKDCIPEQVLDDYKTQMLNRLRADIYGKRRKELKQQQYSIKQKAEVHEEEIQIELF